ncbi:FGGY-family carbohydrate kinase [Glutamicibacter endophyticus]
MSTQQFQTARSDIDSGRAYLGIELGSTRIKAVLIAPNGDVLAGGEHQWENRYENRLWTYSLEAVWEGIQRCYGALVEQVELDYQTSLRQLAGIGISAMMHGYLAFDAQGQLLVPFRTWRNTNTAAAAEQLSARFGCNIPLRWSIAHLWQAMLDHEEHVPRLDRLTTLAGYVHWKLTGEFVLGVGDASGMFPIDSESGQYDARLIASFDELAGDRLGSGGLRALLPIVKRAGENAGLLSADGARLLDPTGTLQAGIALCPPEGDAGTGMVATNSVAVRTGNISAGTSIFAMVVLERALHGAHAEVDLVTTPSGDPVAMVHCNNGASELGAWAEVFTQFAAGLGHQVDATQVYATLFDAARQGSPDAGGLLAYNNLSGEPITGLSEGRPLLVRGPDSQLTLANLMRSQLYAVFSTLSLGLRVLTEQGVQIETMHAHGGLFRTPGVAQQMLAAAIGTPVAVGQGAGEGGAWGIAVLAAYMGSGAREDLADYLQRQIFVATQPAVLAPQEVDVVGYDSYLNRYSAGLAVQRAATEAL